MADFPDGGAAAEIGNDNWATAERATGCIIRQVQPTPESEERRKRVVDYVQRLFRTRFGAEVFPYGSVPLKTYLPDGDIDLTTFGCANVEDALVNDVKSILEEEERNASSAFVVKDVQLICAEVKLVKCIVEGIVVDVSFNQIGGLSTLCFLERVDRLIGKDHLFKRSIILIKAWCYYESRILGAHHSLISTYALEIMVLYIFHHFHSTLDGPLSVLYKFLCYFSNFDWETFCVSLNGPVRRTSFPVNAVEIQEDSGEELLLSSDFLSSCVAMFSVPSTNAKKKSHGFQLKFLNIFDPLNEINNLGRSVNKGNFYRIRSAFSYGARKLRHILLQPMDSIANELHKFFPNTMARHGGGQMLDAETSKISCGRPYHAPHLYFSNSKPHQNSGSDKLESCSNRMGSDEELWGLSGDYERYLRCLQYGQRSYEKGLGIMGALPLPPLPIIPREVIMPRPHYKLNGFSYPTPFMHGFQPMLFLKPRGTGMYITNQPLQGYRPPSTHTMRKIQTPLMLDHSNGGNMVYPEPRMPAYNSSYEWSRDRILPESSYHLKDEDDFPPLPV